MGDNHEYMDNDFLDSDSDESYYGSDIDDEFEANYHIAVDIRRFPNYNKDNLQLGVVYFEVGREPNGIYYYINNPFRGIMKNGRIVYENKYADDLQIERRPSDTIFLKAYDVNKQYYDNIRAKETQFILIPDIDQEFTDDEERGGSRRNKSRKSLKKFHFSSTQKHQHGGKKTVRNVTIRHGKGHKKVTYYKGNKKVSTVKKPLKFFEIHLIKVGKFIPGLFKDCGCGKKHRTRKNKQRKN